MKYKYTATQLRTINYMRPALVALIVLLIPLVAMQFSEDVNWGPGDFIGIGVFIYVFGLIFVLSMVKVPKHRKLVGGLILLVFFTLYVLMVTTD